MTSNTITNKAILRSNNITPFINVLHQHLLIHLVLNSLQLEFNGTPFQLLKLYSFFGQL
jgi:hypothetical protein